MKKNKRQYIGENILLEESTNDFYYDDEEMSKNDTKPIRAYFTGISCGFAIFFLLQMVFKIPF